MTTNDPPAPSGGGFCKHWSNKAPKAISGADRPKTDKFRPYFNWTPENIYTLKLPDTANQTYKGGVLHPYFNRPQYRIKIMDSDHASETKEETDGDPIHGCVGYTILFNNTNQGIEERCVDS